jgi:aminoglycoside phosphotransferase (APT) family kinase protein/putative sterol carrier protein
VLSNDVDPSDLQVKLTGWLQRKLPEARDLTIADVERSGAGFANVSIPFTLHYREGGRQRTQGMLFRGAGRSDPVYPDFKLDRQFRVMSCLRDTAVPVPRVHWMERDASLFGFPFYLMSRIAGDVPSEFPPYHSFGICREATPEKRARMWWGTLEAMAAVHALDWESLGLAFLGVPPDGPGALGAELDYWEHYLDWAKDERQPILEAGLRWLRENEYAPPRVSLCWGDARLPNTIFGPDGEVRGLLDWDMAILSDPVSDLSFFLTLDHLLSAGTGVSRLEGFPGEEETVRRYAELTGRKVENFFYNQVFSALRAGVVILRVQKNLQRMGIELPGENPMLDNMCTRRLAELLELPAPGAAEAERPMREDVSGTIQLHFTGPGGGDWIVVSESGATSRRAGAAADPDVAVTVRAEDWASILRGETNPFNAWTGGRLEVTGNGALFQQLVDAIIRAWKADAQG